MTHLNKGKNLNLVSNAKEELWNLNNSKSKSTINSSSSSSFNKFKLNNTVVKQEDSESTKDIFKYKFNIDSEHCQIFKFVKFIIKTHCQCRQSLNSKSSTYLHQYDSEKIYRKLFPYSRKSSARSIKSSQVLLSNFICSIFLSK